MTSNEIRAICGLGMIFSLRMLGMFMVLPVLSTCGLALHGASEMLIGLAIGIYGLTQAVFQIPFGLLSDRIGCKPIIISGLLIFIIGSVIASFSYSIWGIIIGRALQGSGAVTSAVMALLSDLTQEQNRTKAMAFIGASFGITFVIAMILGPVITRSFGMQTIFEIMAILAIISIPLILWVVPDSKKNVLNRNSYILKDYLSRVLIEPRLLKINFSIMCLHILLMFIFVSLPNRLMLAGFPVAEHWKIYLITMIVSFVSIIPSIIYAEAKGCMKIMFISCIFLLLNAEMIFWCAGLHFWELVTGIQIFFLSFNLIEVLLPSLISKESSVDCKGTAMGVYSTSQFIGTAIGGCVGGLIDSSLNSRNIFLAGIIITIIWLIVASTMKEPPHI